MENDLEKLLRFQYRNMLGSLLYSAQFRKSFYVLFAYLNINLSRSLVELKDYYWGIIRLKYQIIVKLVAFEETRTMHYSKNIFHFCMIS